MSVGATIKRLRIEKGLTQEELGDLLGVKKAAVQKYESGQVQNLKQSTIRKLCDIFDTIPANFIFDDFDSFLEQQLKSEVGHIEVVQSLYGKEAVTMLEVFVGLNDESKAKVLDYATDMELIQSVRSVRKV